MKKELRDQLEAWKTSAEFHLPSKNYRTTKSPIVDGEYLIYLTRKVKVNFHDISRIISISKKMHTRCQSESLTAENPKSDELILFSLIKQLDDEFFDLYIKTENELVQEIMPDGFF